MGYSETLVSSNMSVDRRSQRAWNGV
jgi:hypothetical protein